MDSRINEIARDKKSAYGVRIYVCNNDEVIRDRTVGTGAIGNDHGQGVRDATRLLFDSGHDYELVSAFREYNGGPRRSLVEFVCYIAKVKADGEIGDWIPCTNSCVPAGDIKIISDLCEEAEALIRESMERAEREAEAENAENADDVE